MALPASAQISATVVTNTALWRGEIVAGNPVCARQVMEEHCDDTAALLRGLIG